MKFPTRAPLSIVQVHSRPQRQAKHLPADEANMWVYTIKLSICLIKHRAMMTYVKWRRSSTHS